MLKLLSLNMEGLKHLDRVTELISNQKPDCICLLEMPSQFVLTLVRAGYYPIFAPMARDTGVSAGETLGVCIATKRPAQTEVRYYDGTTAGIPSFDTTNKSGSCSFPIVYATLSHEDGHEYQIATTHIMVTPDGHETTTQTASVHKLLTMLAPRPAHILCGDFNIPRGYNSNYELLTAAYTDSIPEHFKSSLDQKYHRNGALVDINAPIFDIYMVDYIFSQPPYIVSDVRLQFGVSDHAALLATIHIKS